MCERSASLIPYALVCMSFPPLSCMFVCMRVFIWLCSASITIPRLSVEPPLFHALYPNTMDLISRIQSLTHVYKRVSTLVFVCVCVCLLKWITIVHLKFIAQNVFTNYFYFSIFFFALIALFVIFMLLCFPFDWRHTKSSYPIQHTYLHDILALVRHHIFQFLCFISQIFFTTAVKAIILFSSLDICNLCYENIKISMAIQAQGLAA